jgi:hypothetical protein
MHQQNNCEFESTDQIAERQTNYLILRTLESKLDPNLFSALIQQVTFFFLFFRSPEALTFRSILPGMVPSIHVAILS